VANVLIRLSGVNLHKMSMTSNIAYLI